MGSNSEQVTEYFHAIIAGKQVEIECKYRDVFRTCYAYLCKFDKPDIVISVTQEEIERERLIANQTAQADGRYQKAFSSAALETMAVYRKLSETLLDDGFLMVHSAAIAAKGHCYLFMAKSGTGKTTHIKKWLRLFPDTFVVNGDKPLVDVNNLQVYGTPWCGKENMNTNTRVPLGGLIWLERGEENEIKPISFSQMLPCLMHQCYIPEGGRLTVKAIQLLNRLQNIPCWHLKCNMEDEAGEISYNALVQNCR